MDTMIYVFELLALVIGAFACFAGYRVLKSIVPICSFAVGAAIGVVIAVKFDMAIGVAVMVVLGLMLSIVSFTLYMAGVFAVIAFMAAMGIYIACGNILVSMVAGVLIGVVAIFLVRHVSIVTTALSGAAIVIWSALVLVGLDNLQKSLIWIALWFVIAAAGVVCQYLTSRTESVEFDDGFFGSIGRADDISFSERKYPGMQRTYRNYCIKCGFEMDGSNANCPRCGFSFDD